MEDYVLSAGEQTKLGNIGGVYFGRLGLHREDITYEGSICICRCPFMPVDNYVKSWLHVEEQKYYKKLVVEKRKKSFFIGRYAAKNAISVLTSDVPKDIHIEYGVFNFPVIISTCRGKRLDISITHSYDFGAAIVFPATHPMGIDIECINPHRAAFIEQELTGDEKKMINQNHGLSDHNTMYTFMWTIKESLSKTLKTGLMTPFCIYEISSMINMDSNYVSYFKHFGQYKTFSFVIRDYICSITVPKNTEIEFNLNKVIIDIYK